MLAEIEANHEEAALIKIRAQLKAHPESARLHYILAKLLDTSGDTESSKSTEEATQAALEAARLKPDMVEAHDLLAGLYARAGQNAKAIEQCRLALAYQPDDQSALYHLLIALRHDETGNHTDEIKALVARVSELKKSSLQQETDRKRFRIVEQSGPEGILPK